MELKIESNFTQTFNTKVVGVTFKNKDDSNRQELISKLKKGEKILLKREYKNEHDKNAIAVYNSNNEQLGYLPSDSLLANHIDREGQVSAVVLQKLGGKTLIDKIFKRSGKNYGLSITIKKGDYNWEKIKPISNSLLIIKKLIEKAKKDETKKPSLSIKNYKKAIDNINELDSKGLLHKAWRIERIPIDRITLLLEKEKRLDDAFELLKWYKSYDDYRGLTAESQKMIDKRYERLMNKLNIKE